MKFRTEEGDDCSFAIVYIDGGERVRDSQVEKEFEDMLNDAVDLLNLEYISHREVYRINEEQAQYLRGAAAGFCFAVNRRLSGGYCFILLRGC